jgi:hypothetical protein
VCSASTTRSGPYHGGPQPGQPLWQCLGGGSTESHWPVRAVASRYFLTGTDTAWVNLSQKGPPKGTRRPPHRRHSWGTATASSPGRRRSRPRWPGTRNRATSWRSGWCVWPGRRTPGAWLGSTPCRDDAMAAQRQCGRLHRRPRGGGGGTQTVSGSARGHRRKEYPPPWLADCCQRARTWLPRFQTVPVGRGLSTAEPRSPCFAYLK